MNRLVLVPLIIALAPVAALAQTPHGSHAKPPAPPPAPHAGHDMSTMTMAPSPAPTPPTPDPHAGHDMSTMTMAPSPAPASPAADPHAGHDMSAMSMAPSPAPAPPAADPHAGHDMSAMAMGPPDVPTSADSPGRSPQAPVPATALTGPAHAADLIFGAADMAASRRGLVVENGDIHSTAVLIDRLEAGIGDGADTWHWDAQGWSGGDINRFWWKSEGEGEFGGTLEAVEIQALYSRAVTPFWNLQAGVRQDLRHAGADTTHLVLGLQGLARHWWEVDATAFLSTDGDLTARAGAEYDQRITQRLILQPRLEIKASASDIPELETGAGLSSVTAGLRLRYEIRKEFAPYLGVEWHRALGNTADYVEARGGAVGDTRFIIGLKAWF
jgi:copper resistance protein B